MKILLKTKDDHFFIERWIEHHGRIVGLDNLVVFDNCSTDERVLSVYQKYADSVHVVRFSGGHNRVHQVEYFPELYEALRRSTAFFAFLDTDEYLTLLVDDRCVSDAEIVDFLESRRDVAAFPGTWLENLPGSDRRFAMGGHVHRFGEPLVWGKPIISTNTDSRGFLTHNVQLDKSLFDGHIFTNLFVLHLKHLFPQQRIAANVRKLIERGFASSTDSIDDILARETNHIVSPALRSNIRNWVREIGQLRDSEGPGSPAAASTNRYVELAEGRLHFSAHSGRRALATYLNSAQPFVRALLHVDESEIVESAARFRQKCQMLAKSFGLDES